MVCFHCEQYNPDPRPPTHTSGTSCSFAPSPLWRKYAPKFARGYVFFSRAARQRYYSNLMYSTCSVQCTTCAAREGRIGIFKFFCCLQLGRGISYCILFASTQENPYEHIYAQGRAPYESSRSAIIRTYVVCHTSCTGFSLWISPRAPTTTSTTSKSMIKIPALKLLSMEQQQLAATTAYGSFPSVRASCDVRCICFY